MIENDLVSRRLIQLREEAGYSQSDLAKLLSISRNTVFLWENGTNMPSGAYLIELSRLYSRSTDYILGIDRQEALWLDEYDQDERDFLFGTVKFIEKKRKNRMAQ